MQQKCAKNMKPFTLQVLTEDNWKKMNKKNLRVNIQRFEAVEVN